MRPGIISVLAVGSLTVLVAAGLVGFSVDPPLPEPIARPEAEGHPAGIAFRAAARGKKPPGALMRAREHRDEMIRFQAERVAEGGREVAGLNQNSWELLGPPDIGGRVRSIVIHSEFDDFMLVGAATGASPSRCSAASSRRRRTPARARF